MSESTVALLPMKAHSERVPNKNFRRFAGRPLFQWILDALLGVAKIDCVLINTDARSILLEAGLRESSRVVIRDRAPELCGDLVSMNKILEDDIESLAADRYVMSHATSPLITAATITKAIEYFDDHRHSIDSLFSVNRVQSRFYRQDMTAVNHDPNKLIRTQDLDPWYEENSCIYVFTRESFAATGARIGAKPGFFVTPRLESVDIDDDDDWKLAEALARSSVAAVVSSSNDA